ncbi:hypothetical protein IG631_23658 [Alternaria alternata]|nr:hypothetical protein IG631_23658 [Alternaria alternata]
MWLPESPVVANIPDAIDAGVGSNEDDENAAIWESLVSAVDAQGNVEGHGKEVLSAIEQVNALAIRV